MSFQETISTFNLILLIILLISKETHPIIWKSLMSILYTKNYKSQKSPLLTTSKFLSIFPCKTQENVHRIYVLARVCFCLSFSCSRLIKIIKPRNLNKLRYSIHINKKTIYWQHNSKGKHDIAFLLWRLYSRWYNVKPNFFVNNEFLMNLNNSFITLKVQNYTVIQIVVKVL